MDSKMEENGTIDATSPKASARRKRVRSLIRKRGTRGSGRSKQAQKSISDDKEKADVSSRSLHGPHHQKRVRSRKNRNWKPYSQQTWEERLERELAEERKATEQGKVVGGLNSSTSKRAKRKRTNDMEMPKAPRNTTQNLLHTTDYGEDLDVNHRQMPSLQGLLSRETIRLKFLGDDNSRPSSDDEDEARGNNDNQQGGSQADDEDQGPQMNSPAYSSVGSVGSPCPDLSPHHYSITAGSNGGGGGGSRDLERDGLVQELREENRRLRARVETLERELAERDRQPPS
jgi:hypothetical protein